MTPDDLIDNARRIIADPTATMEDLEGAARVIDLAQSVKDLRKDLAVATDQRDRYLAAIRHHHAQKADDRCFLDDDLLYQAAGLPSPDRRVGDQNAMLANCRRFIQRRTQGGGWPTYVELEETVAKLQAFKDWVHAYLDQKGVPHHPPGPHGAEGCRIGDRMDWVFAELAKLREQIAGHVERIAARSELLSLAAERESSPGGQ